VIEESPECLLQPSKSRNGGHNGGSICYRFKAFRTGAQLCSSGKRPQYQVSRLGLGSVQARNQNRIKSHDPFSDEQWGYVIETMSQRNLCGEAAGGNAAKH